MEGLTEADGARAQALGVLAALISTVLNSRPRFCGMNVLMTRETTAQVLEELIQLAKDIRAARAAKKLA